MDILGVAEKLVCRLLKDLQRGRREKSTAEAYCRTLSRRLSAESRVFRQV